MNADVEVVILPTSVIFLKIFLLMFYLVQLLEVGVLGFRLDTQTKFDLSRFTTRILKATWL